MPVELVPLRRLKEHDFDGISFHERVTGPTSRKRNSKMMYNEVHDLEDVRILRGCGAKSRFD